LEGKNKMDSDMIAPIIVGVFAVLFFFGCVTFSIIDNTYKFPQAAKNANQICQEKGFDYYESFERIGFLSTEPVAIKCKYVTNYQEMDIKLQQTFGGSNDLNE